MGPRPDALTAAIDEAWRVFDLPAPADLGVCTDCCMDPALAAEMQSRPARALSDLHVLEWHDAAFDPAPTHAQVTWLLPRVLEMLAHGKAVARVGNEVAFARLPLAGFPDSWPERQVHTLNRFALAYLDMRLTSAPPLELSELDHLLCMFGQGGFDLAPLLRRIEALPDGDLARLLHRTWFHCHSGEIGFDAFWDREPGRSIAWAWYTSQTLMDRMERPALSGSETALEVHALIAETRAKDGL